MEAAFFDLSAKSLDKLDFVNSRLPMLCWFCLPRWVLSPLWPQFQLCQDQQSYRSRLPIGTTMGCIDTNFCLSDTDPEVLACLFADHAEIVCKIGIHPIADGNLCCHNPSLFPHHRYRIIRTLGLLASLLAILCTYFHASSIQLTKSKHQYRSFSLFPLQTDVNPLVKVVMLPLFPPQRMQKLVWHPTNHRFPCCLSPSKVRLDDFCLHTDYGNGSTNFPETSKTGTAFLPLYQIYFTFLSIQSFNFSYQYLQLLAYSS